MNALSPAALSPAALSPAALSPAALSVLPAPERPGLLVAAPAPVDAPRPVTPLPPLAPSAPRDLGTLRLLPAPVSAPPYDDELVGRPALRLVPPLRPVRRAAPRVVGPAEDGWRTPGRTPVSELPAAEAHARRLVRALVEVAAGVRPLTQLRREATPELYTWLAAQLSGRPRAEGARPNARAVRSLHVQQRSEGVAEVCATVERAGRVAALALRLEGVSGRWTLTEVAGI